MGANMAMTIALFGATGRTGRRVLQELLARGHHVRALVRSAGKLGGVDLSRVTEVVGDACDAQSVEQVVAGADAVISTLGVARGSPTDVVSRSMEVLLPAMARHGVRRVVALTGAGARLDGERGAWWEDGVRGLLSLVAGPRLRDGQRMLDLVSASQTEWTVVRTQLQVDGDLSGALAVGTIGDPRAGWRVARRDLARFLVDCVEQGTYLRQAPVVWMG